MVDRDNSRVNRTNEIEGAEISSKLVEKFDIYSAKYKSNVDPFSQLGARAQPKHLCIMNFFSNGSSIPFLIDRLDQVTLRRKGQRLSQIEAYGDSAYCLSSIFYDLYVSNCRNSILIVGTVYHHKAKLHEMHP